MKTWLTSRFVEVDESLSGPFIQLSRRTSSGGIAEAEVLKDDIPFFHEYGVLAKSDQKNQQRNILSEFRLLLRLVMGPSIGREKT